MRLYERLILHSKPDVRAALLKAVPVILDNVAHYYWTENPKEEWDLREDFPNCAPPWETAFYEWKFPALSNSEGKLVQLGLSPGDVAGLLVHSGTPLSIKDDPETLERAVRMALMGHLSREMGGANAARDYVRQHGGIDRVMEAMPADIRHEVADRIRSTEDSTPKPRWMLDCTYFMHLARGGMGRGPLTRYTVGLNDSGMVMSHGDNPFCSISLFDETEVPNLESALSWAKRLNTMPLNVPLLGVSLTHCKNIAVVENEVASPRRVTKHLPGRKLIVKTLRIESVRDSIRRSSGEASISPMRMHICRGHFKDYRESGLFGRYRGIYWWEMTTRGNPSVGTVEKSYEVSPT